MTAGSSGDFSVRPAALGSYAELLRGQTDRLRGVTAAIDEVAVPPEWFGRLPESGRLADRYAGHREAELAGLAQLPELLSAMAAALDVNAALYEDADAAAADAIASI